MANNIYNPKRTNDRKNKYGLRYNYVSGRLRVMAKGAIDTRPNEMIQYLIKLAFEIDPELASSTADRARR